MSVHDTSTPKMQNAPAASPDHPYSDDELRDALLYVAQRTPRARCPLCAHESWTYDDDKAKGRAVPRVTYVPFTNRAFFGPAPSIPTISLTCDNCGYVRNHSIPMIISNLKGQKSDG